MAGPLKPRWVNRIASVEGYLAAAHTRRDADARQRLEPRQHPLLEDERHQGRPCFGHRDTEARREPVTEIAGAHFRNGFSARRHDERLTLNLLRARGQRQHEAGLGPLDVRDRGCQSQLRVALFELGQQQIDDLLRRTVAEQLAERLFVIRNAVAFHQGDEIAGAVAMQRGNAEMRIARQEILGCATQIGEIASPAARDADLLSRRSRMIEHENRAAALAGLRRAHESRRARSDNNDVPPIHQRFSTFAKKGLQSTETPAALSGAAFFSISAPMKV